MIATGTAEQTETRRAFDNPRVRGTCRTRRSVHQARAIIVMASSALPMAPAVVPRGRAPRPTAIRSISVGDVYPKYRFHLADRLQGCDKEDALGGEDYSDHENSEG